MKLIIKKKHINIIEANSFIKRFIGLMGKKNINYGMMFYKTNSIHTFFMKEKIDIIGLNENNIVIFKKENLKPNRILIIKNKAKKTRVLELPNNSSKHINVNDTLTFISE